MSWLQRAAVAGMVALSGCLAPALATAQEVSPVGALAYTTCLGGHIKTYIDATIVGSDSAAEILVHEAVHRMQQARDAAPGLCPRYKPWELLASEVEAYCVSRPLRMARGWTELETDINYITRLLNQFKGAMPRRDVIHAYRVGCPAKGMFQITEEVTP